MLQEQGEQGEKIASIKTKTKNCTLTCQPLKPREDRGAKSSARSSLSGFDYGSGLSSSSIPQSFSYGFGNSNRKGSGFDFGSSSSDFGSSSGSSSSDFGSGSSSSPQGLGSSKIKSNKLRLGLEKPAEFLTGTNVEDFNMVSPINLRQQSKTDNRGIMDVGGGRKTKRRKTKRRKTKRKKTKRRKH